MSTAVLAYTGHQAAACTQASIPTPTRTPSHPPVAAVHVQRLQVGRLQPVHAGDAPHAVSRVHAAHLCTQGGRGQREHAGVSWRGI